MSVFTSTSTDNLGLSIKPIVHLGCGNKPGKNRTSDLLVCTPLCFYPHGCS